MIRLLCCWRAARDSYRASSVITLSVPVLFLVADLCGCCVNIPVWKAAGITLVCYDWDQAYFRPTAVLIASQGTENQKWTLL